MASMIFFIASASLSSFSRIVSAIPFNSSIIRFAPASINGGRLSANELIRFVISCRPTSMILGTFSLRASKNLRIRLNPASNIFGAPLAIPCANSTTRVTAKSTTAGIRAVNPTINKPNAPITPAIVVAVIAAKPVSPAAIPNNPIPTPAIPIPIRPIASANATIPGAAGPNTNPATPIIMNAPAKAPSAIATSLSERPERSISGGTRIDMAAAIINMDTAPPILPSANFIAPTIPNSARPNTVSPVASSLGSVEPKVFIGPTSALMAPATSNRPKAALISLAPLVTLTNMASSARMIVSATSPCFNWSTGILPNSCI